MLNTVLKLHRLAGLKPVKTSTVLKSGVVCDGGRVALGHDVSRKNWGWAIHDLCHWLIAPAERRNLPNFGHDGNPAVREKVVCVPVVDHDTMYREEVLASVLNVVLAYRFLGDDAGMSVADPCDLAREMDGHTFSARIERDYIPAFREMGLYPFPETLEEFEKMARARIQGLNPDMVFV